MTTTQEKTADIAKKLNEQVALVQKNDFAGFERAYILADAIAQLNEILTPQYMKPIMALQGNKLGFKTDKDDDGGYPEAVVKRCLIEAVLTGLQPVGNQFNIISGNMYPTKEGCGYLLNNTEGLTDWKITPELPRMTIRDDGSGSAAIKMNIERTFKGESTTDQIDFPIKVNKRMGTDAVIGKATRKARAWLLNNINKKLGKSEITDGDVQDVKFEVMGEEKKTLTKEEIEEDRIIKLIQACGSLSKLHELEKHAATEKAKASFEARKQELLTPKE
jgi:hypothetical protein